MQVRGPLEDSLGLLLRGSLEDSLGLLLRGSLEDSLGVQCKWMTTQPASRNLATHNMRFQHSYLIRLADLLCGHQKQQHNVSKGEAP